MLALLLFLQLAQQPGDLDRILGYQRALQEKPGSEDDIVGLATVLFSMERSEKAIELLEPFVQRNPQAYRARLFLAFGHVQEEKYETARVLAQGVVTRRPDDHYARHVHALALLGLNRFNEAEAALRKAISLKDDFAESHLQLGLLLSRSPATMENSHTSLNRALELGGDQSVLRKSLASVCIKLRRYDEAIDHLKAALNSGIESAELFFLLADAYRKAGKSGDAAAATRDFQRLSASENDSRTRLTRAQALYQEGMALLANSDDLGGAYDRFRTAAETFPDLDPAYYRMAQIEYLRRQYPRALAYIRRAIELNVSEAEYYFVLARCLEGSDQAGALEAITRAVTLNAGVADFHHTMGALLEKRSDYAGAVRSYRSAVALEPETPVFHLALSVALAKNGQKEESDRERLIYERLSSKPRLLNNDDPAGFDFL